MKSLPGGRVTIHTFFILLFISIQVFFSSSANAWTSALYPEDWTPGYTDGQGHFLQDFSYAGYHRGEQPIPANPALKIYDVTKPPYKADNTGLSDAAPAIQSALNDAKRTGGGIIYLPPGTYRINNPSTITIDASNIVLRGAGSGKTRLYLDVENARENSLIFLGQSANDWRDELSGTQVTVTSEITVDAKTIKVNRIPVSINVGDDIIITHDITPAWVDDHGMRPFWIKQVNRTYDPAYAPRYYRTVTNINPVSNEITVDVPIRYTMKPRDNTRIYKPSRLFVTEVGIEHLSIGMKQHPAYNGVLPSTTSRKKPDGTEAEQAAYQLHKSTVIRIEGVKNGWMKDVITYRPEGNTADIHIHSGGINIVDSRHITIMDTRVEKPQSRTGGGNGYLFRLDNSQENLIVNSTAVKGRHNFAIQFFRTSGNVFHNYTSIDSLFPNDTHGPTMSPANLIDNSTFSGLDSEYWGIGMRNRGHVSSGAGYTATQSVMWNVVSGSPYDIYKKANPAYYSRPFYSQQFAKGYIIGTSAINGGNYYTCPPVKSDPLYKDPNLKACKSSNDYVEGVGKGATLQPQSLYLDQLSKRLSKNYTNSAME